MREVDCSFLLRGTLGTRLTDPGYFRQARVDEDARTVVWPNGLDPAPELLHGGYEPATRRLTYATRARVDPKQGRPAQLVAVSCGHPRAREMGDDVGVAC